LYNVLLTLLRSKSAWTGIRFKVFVHFFPADSASVKTIRNVIKIIVFLCNKSLYNAIFLFKVVLYCPNMYWKYQCFIFNCPELLNVAGIKNLKCNMFYFKMCNNFYLIFKIFYSLPYRTYSHRARVPFSWIFGAM